MKIIKWILICFVLLVVVGGIVGYYVINYTIEKTVQKGVEVAGPPILKAPIKLGDVNLSIFSGKAQLLDFEIGNPEGFKTPNCFKFDNFEVTLDTSSIGTDKIVLKEVIVQGAEISYELNIKNRKSNIKTIEDNINEFIGASSEDETEESSDEGPQLIIERFVMENCKIKLAASFTGGKALPIPLPRIEMKDIGKEKTGGPAAAIKEVFGKISGGISEALAANKELIGNAKEKATDVIDNIKEGGTGVKDKIKGLFGK